jgi:penicillin V acylase-like amidase (Ntn superfamily)
MQHEYPRDYKPHKNNIFCIKLNEYLLCNYTNCKSILKDLDNLNILLTPVNKKNYSLHWIIADKSGDCYVLELVNGKLHYYFNSDIKVITNSPSFQIHRKDVKIARRNLSNVTKKGSFSQGTGAIGLVQVEVDLFELIFISTI